MAIAVTILAVLYYLFRKFVSPEGHTPTPDTNGTFNWSTITPSASIDYRKCYDGFQCARLQVPLDWKDPNNPETVAVAIVRLPAKVPITDDRYGGAVLINPGGPGGSGVLQAINKGEQMQHIIDAP